MQVHVQTLVVAVAAPALALAADQGTTQRDEGFRGAVTAPLEDLNIKQADIPPVLVRAMAGPYDMQGLGRCEALAAEVGRLDAALGPDPDEAPPPDRRTTGQKIAAQAKAAAVGEVRARPRICCRSAAGCASSAALSVIARRWTARSRPAASVAAISRASACA